MKDFTTLLQDKKNIIYQKDTSNSCQTKNYTFSSEIQDPKNSKKEFFCEKCSKYFSTSGNLRTHIMIIHDNYRPFKCTFPNCTKKYATISKLVAHERTHTGIKPFICQICQKSFNEKGNLKAHLKFHSEIRPFKCPLCDKRYKSNVHLKDHIRIQHYQIKKFRCQFCNKSFGRTSALKVHVRKHIDKKRFQCKFEGCGKRFAEKRNMEKHYKSHFKNLDQTIKNDKAKKTYGSKKIRKDFEEKIKIALSQLDKKNTKEIKTEEKKENKIDVNSIKKNENLLQKCSDDIKCNDINNLNNFYNSNSGNILKFSNYFPLIFNLRKSDSNNLNNITEKVEKTDTKNEKISDNNYFYINNINNNSYSNINNYSCINSNCFTGPNYNNFNIFIFTPQNYFL